MALFLRRDVFERFVSFPVALATFGMSVILLTVAAQRRWPELARRLAAGRAGEPRMPGGHAIPAILAGIAVVMLVMVAVVIVPYLISTLRQEHDV